MAAPLLKKSLPLASLFLAVAACTLFGASKSSTNKELQGRQRALHALNRLSFGPRPGEVGTVQSMGVDKWIEQQLHPEKIDNSALEARLAPFRTLKMDAKEMIENFPPKQVLKQVADGKMSMPSDPDKRAVYEAALEGYRMRQQLKAANGDENASDNSPPDAQNPQGRFATLSPEKKAELRHARANAEDKAEEMLAMSPEDRYTELMKMSPMEREVFARRLDPADRDTMMNDLSPKQRETIMAMNRPEAVVTNELMQSKILRATYSNRQLEEVMTDFWFNHFNVYINKGADRYLITSYERDVIRPHVFGKFKDLLLATAKSPAMLFYLDNFQSVGPDSDFAKNGPGGQRRNQFRGFNRRGGFARRPQQPQRAKQNQNRRNGLNENYAREVMELHTLGVDGGYTQKDVTDLAKVLTGWTIKEPRRGGGYEFNERMHEPGKKIVLGKEFKDDGEREGEKALEMLASSPATAHFISTKLAMRFVSDDPPKALVDRMAQTFLKSDGDIREVLRTMFKSSEFWAPQSYRAKVKTPFEFVVSALRSTNADVTNAMPLAQALNRMGMPLYGMQPPTGYSMKAETWVNSAALLNRMNTALSLGAGKMQGTKVDAQAALPPNVSTGDQILAALEKNILDGDVSQQTDSTIRKQLSDPKITERALDDPARAPNPGVIAGLILGSPEFQRR
jgi:uncharacterized protein (DUF1800 family)